MRVHGIMESSRANGPGSRAVVWLQGCRLGCAGCWNPKTHPMDGGQEWGRIRLTNWLLKRPGIEGVTFSGGEPMHQAEDLLALCESLRRKRPELSLGMYTGYDRRELESGRFYMVGVPDDAFKRRERAWWRLGRCLDFVVRGRYNAAQPCSLPMRSSLNQELVLCSNRYREADFPPQLVEVVISEDGSRSQLTGFPKESVNA